MSRFAKTFGALALLAALLPDAASACGGGPVCNCLSAQARFADDCAYDTAPAPYLDVHNDSRQNLALLYEAARGGAAATTPAPSTPATAAGTAAEGGDEWPALRDYAQRLARLAPGVAPRKYEDYEEDSCAGNTYAAASAFLDALAQGSLPPEQRATLARLRNTFVCADLGRSGDEALGPDTVLAAIGAGSGAGAEHAGYLRAAVQFYAGNWDAALDETGKLSGAADPWVRETAALLRARIYMVRAQRTWEGYAEDREAIDPADLASADAALQAYLRDHPAGRWRTSAEGLVRRVRYLAGDDAAYLRGFLGAWRTALSGRAPQASARLLSEAESATPYYGIEVTAGKLGGGVTDDPLLYAAGLLQFLRRVADGETEDPQRLLRTAAGAHAGFGALPGLQAHLLAADAATHADWENAAKHAGSARTQGGPLLRLSALAIEAQALEQLGRHDDAITRWREAAALDTSDAADFLRAGYVRAAMRARRPELLLDAGAKVATQPLAEYAVRHLLGDEALVAAAARPATQPALRKVVVETLLLRRALRGDWPAFVQAYGAAAPADRALLAPVETAARTLAATPEDPKGLLNAGYFLITVAGQIDALEPCIEDTASIDHDLGDLLPGENQGPYTAPAQYFVRGLGQRPGGDLEAKLLYHAIQCYGPAWDQDCADYEIPEGTRRDWFQRLKSQFGDTEWARKAKYWW